jgi:flagellar motor switch protein FliN/FliY
MSQSGISPEEAGVLFGSGRDTDGKEASPATFPMLERSLSMPVDPSTIGMLANVELEVTVQLGQTRRSIREILSLGPGSVLELDRLAGEAIDILVNGRLVGKGEVVVIGENFGVRITELIGPVGGPLK